jgi:hypothetical protein
MDRLLSFKAYQVVHLTMALERLQASAAAGVPDLQGAVPGRRRQPRRVMREGHQADITAMAFECLQAHAAAGVPDLHGAVPGRRRQPRRVV